MNRNAAAFAALTWRGLSAVISAEFPQRITSRRTFGPNKVVSSDKCMHHLLAYSLNWIFAEASGVMRSLQKRRV